MTKSMAFLKILHWEREHLEKETIPRGASFTNCWEIGAIWGKTYPKNLAFSVGESRQRSPTAVFARKWLQKNL